MVCTLDGCGRTAHRRCRVCERPVCALCRVGAGWWVRCYACTAEQMGEAIATLYAQAAEERRLPCRSCGTAMHREQTRHGWWVHRPACPCPAP